MKTEDIFLEAVGRPTPSERAAFLARACGDDPALRDRIEGLIASHEQAGTFLEGDLFDPSPSAGAPLVEGPGTRIGPYELVEAIGEGGMGTVYLAEQARPVRRRVALKVIKPGMDSRQVIARFEAERQALAMMDHPNIARVIDAGTTEAGLPYFVMDLVDGIPITDYCDRARLSVAERLELFGSVCRAVQHAHQKGVIHRDLKPSNVLVTLIDGAAVPKVIDFGVAKAIGDPLTEGTLLTGFQQLVGTPLYMSPEQAGISGMDVDTRSDVYSLGVLLYELLTGTTPIDRESFRKAAHDEIRRVIREQDPPTPSTRLSTLGETLHAVSGNRQSDPRRLGHTLRGELDWVVMKALEKDRARRYESVGDFAADLSRYLADRPVEARRPSRAYLLRKFVRRNRGRVAASGLIVGLGMALAVAVGWQAAERAARRAETAGAVAQALDVADRWARLAKWPEAMAATQQAEAILGTVGGDEALRRRCQSLRDDLAMVLRLDEIRLEMSAVKGNAFDSALGDRLYAEAFRAYGIDPATSRPDDIASRMPIGPVRDELVAALDDWARVRRLPRGSRPGDWMPLLALARAFDPDPWRDGVREAWMRDDRQALALSAASAPLDRLHPCSVLLLQASLDAEPAATVLRQALQHRPGDFWLNEELGRRLFLVQPPRANEALGYLRAAVALRPESPGATLNLGYCLELAGRNAEAIPVYERAIRLKPDYAVAHRNLGMSLLEAGQVEAAVLANREAIRLEPQSTLGQNRLARALVALGNLRHEAGAPVEAIASFREAIDLRPDDMEAHRGLGHALWDVGRFGEALAASRRAQELGCEEPPWLYPSRHWAEACEALLGMKAPMKVAERSHAMRHFLSSLTRDPCTVSFLNPLSTRNLSMRRSFIMLALSASTAFATIARAQNGPGAIYYETNSPQAVYKVAGDGTQNTKVGDFPNFTDRVSSLAIYPGGRQFQHCIAVGTIPGTTAQCSDMTLRSESGITTVTLSNFRGPEYVEDLSRYKHSNDGQDSFFSFVVYNVETGLRVLYRYNGPLSDVFAPDFTPFVSGDPRLTPVATFPQKNTFGDWDSSGRWMFYHIRQASGDTWVYMLDAMDGSSTLVNNPTVSGIDFTGTHCSPTELRLVSVATSKTSGARGIVSFDPLTGRYSWVIQEGGSGKKKVSSFSHPVVSPDGTVLAFAMLRVSGGKTCPSLVRIPIWGGAYTPLVTLRASSVNTLDPSDQGWTW